jgi:hypothetical protein
MLLASTATPLMSGRKSLITVRPEEQLMLDTQNQSPQCMDCDSPMTLTAIEPGGLGQDLRAFTCEKCKRVERHIIESAVTEEWLKPQRAVKASADELSLTRSKTGG